MIVNVCISDGIASKRFKQRDNFCQQCGKRYTAVEVLENAQGLSTAEIVEGA